MAAVSVGHASHKPELAEQRQLVGQRLVAVVAGLAVAVGTVHYTRTGGASYRDMAQFGGYWLLAVITPGWLVHRASRGPQRSWVSEVFLGATTGLALELIAWALFTSLGAAQYLILWPLLTLGVLSRRSWRARIRMPTTDRLPALSTLALAIASLGILRSFSHGFFRMFGAPYRGARIYPDLLWDMGIAEETKRSFPPGTAEVVGDGTLHYHWFANVNMGVSSRISGIDVPTVVEQLWPVPFALLAIAGACALAHELSHRGWAGVLGGVMTTASGVMLWRPGITQSFATFLPGSPSQMYGMSMMTAVVLVVVVLLRRATGRLVSADGFYERDRTVGPDARFGSGRLGGRVDAGLIVIAVLAGIGCVGAKASVTPTLFGGACLAALVCLLSRRGVRTGLIVLAGSAILLIGAAKVVAGGSAGSGFQLFAVMRPAHAYAVLGPHPSSTTAAILPGIFTSPSIGPLLFIGILLEDVNRLLPIVVGMLVVWQLRRDMAAWFLAGLLAAATLAFYVIYHQGLSEWYFAKGVLLIGCSVMAWSLSVAIDSAQRSTGRYRSELAWVWACGTVAILGNLITTDVFAYKKVPVGVRAFEHYFERWMIGWVILVLGVLALAIAARLHTRRRGAAVAVVLAVCAGLVVGNASLNILRHKKAYVNPTTPTYLAEARASLWIRAHIPEDALMATNQHCVGPEATTCSSQQWWLSGLAGRRVLVGGWSYTPQAANNNPFNNLPLLAENQAAFTAASPADLAKLRAKGVQYLVVVRGATPVAPRLRTEIPALYSNSLITILRLK